MEVDNELLRRFLFRSHFAAGMPYRLLAQLSVRDVPSSTGPELLSLIDSWTEKTKTRTEKKDQAEAEKGGRTWNN